MSRLAVLLLCAAGLFSIRAQEQCTGGVLAGKARLLRERLVWEDYWSLEGTKLDRVRAPVDMLIFWNDSLLGYCSNELRTCAAYGFDAASSTLGQGWLFLNQLDAKASNEDLERAFVKRLEDGPGVVVTRGTSLPLPFSVGQPCKPDSVKCGEAERLGTALGPGSPVWDELAKRSPRKILVNTCVVHNVNLEHQIPESIRSRMVPPSMESLTAWWRKKCRSLGCAPATLTVPYYSDADAEVFVLLEGLPKEEDTIYLMQRQKDYQGGWQIGAHFPSHASEGLLSRLKGASALRVKLP